MAGVSEASVVLVFVLVVVVGCCIPNIPAGLLNS